MVRFSPTTTTGRRDFLDAIMAVPSDSIHRINIIWGFASDRQLVNGHCRQTNRVADGGCWHRFIRMNRQKDRKRGKKGMTERISSLNCLRISTIKSNKYNTKVYLFIICVDKERWDMKMNGPLTKALDLKACLCAVNAFSISSTSTT